VFLGSNLNILLEPFNTGWVSEKPEKQQSIIHNWAETNQYNSANSSRRKCSSGRGLRGLRGLYHGDLWLKSTGTL